MARKENGYYPATLAWGLAVINGLGGHILPYFIDQGDLRYVPGAFQSLFMVPMGLWVLLVVFKKEGLLMGTLVPLVFGILWHAIGLATNYFFPFAFCENSSSGKDSILFCSSQQLPRLRPLKGFLS